ncbi:MAG TPA: helix-turn-helix domain-containing protein [Solirubrobacterales bacterium]|nr:helix-turn-helix domain-containing protein [Solirubrobacterales bacterium]
MSSGIQPRGELAGGLLDGIADPVKLGVVRTLAQMGTATVAELRDGCQTSVPTLRRHLEAMATRGIVAEEMGASDGLTPGRPATRFRLAAESREAVCALLGLSPRPAPPEPSPARTR